MSCGKPCGCDSYRTHVLTVSVSASATPTRRAATVAMNQDEARWDIDRPAYKRLRENGTQPKNVLGCAELEMKASTRLEVESGQLLTPVQRKQYETLTDRSADDGL